MRYGDGRGRARQARALRVLGAAYPIFLDDEVLVMQTQLRDTIFVWRRVA